MDLGMRTALSRANIRDLASSVRFRSPLRPLLPLREAFVFSDFYLRGPAQCRLPKFNFVLGLARCARECTLARSQAAYGAFK